LLGQRDDVCIGEVGEFEVEGHAAAGDTGVRLPRSRSRKPRGT
jgi:hypothetical protein